MVPWWWSWLLAGVGVLGLWQATHCATYGKSAQEKTAAAAAGEMLVAALGGDLSKGESTRTSEILGPPTSSARSTTALHRAVQLLPLTWMDPLLTGPEGIGAPPYDGRTIERLLRGVADRLRSELGP